MALCDVNASRLGWQPRRLADQGRAAVGRYGADEFDRMIAEQRPDTVIVTTPDYLHDLYIVRALRAGCDVITEKPMTIDLARLKRIVDAQLETGRAVTVTFNYRYNPANTQLKDVLDVRRHRRDHGRRLPLVPRPGARRRLLPPLASRQGQVRRPARAQGDPPLRSRQLVGRVASGDGIRDRLPAVLRPRTAESLGLAGHGERCHGCARSAECPYVLDLADDPELKSLYLDAEGADGYVRDRCIFSDEITIEDTMQVQVGYANGVSMNYTLCAYSPWEGYEIVFYGTDGELNHRHVGVHGIFGGERHEADDGATTTLLHRHGEEPRQLDVWSGEGDHGGGDPVMLDQLLNPAAADDPVPASREPCRRRVVDPDRHLRQRRDGAGPDGERSTTCSGKPRSVSERALPR